MLFECAAVIKRPKSWYCKTKEICFFWQQFCAKDYDVVSCSLMTSSSFAILHLIHQQDLEEKHRNCWFSDLTLALWHSSVWEVWLATFWKNKEVNTEFRWETLAVAYLGKYIIKNTCSFLEKKRYSTRKRKFVYHFYGNQQREKYKLESLDYESLLFFVQILHPSHVIEVVWVMFILKPA